MKSEKKIPNAPEKKKKERKKTHIPMEQSGHWSTVTFAKRTAASAST
jgi:hypothetical protein